MIACKSLVFWVILAVISYYDLSFHTVLISRTTKEVLDMHVWIELHRVI